MSTLISLLILVLVGGLVWWLVTLIPLPQPFKQAAQIIVILIFILYLLGALFGGVSFPTLRL